MIETMTKPIRADLPLEYPKAKVGNLSLLCVDPGASGGFAWQHGSNKPFADSMADTDGEIVEALRVFKQQAQIEGNEARAYVEEVGGYVGGGGQPGSAMFKFGRGYGFLLGTLMALGYRVELIRPQRWQKHFCLGTKSGCDGSTPAQKKSAWKKKLQSQAQRLYPDQKVTLSTADALLILEFAKQNLGH